MLIYLVLIGSIAYYAISVAEVWAARQKMCKKYADILVHYRKVLPEEEISQITDDGKPLIKAKDTLKYGIIRWSIVWIGLIIAAFILIDCAGDGPHIVENVIIWLKGILTSLGKLIPQVKN